jgi:hypothetical protein
MWWQRGWIQGQRALAQVGPTGSLSSSSSRPGGVDSRPEGYSPSWPNRLIIINIIIIIKARGRGFKDRGGAFRYGGGAFKAGRIGLKARGGGFTPGVD